MLNMSKLISLISKYQTTSAEERRVEELHASFLNMECIDNVDFSNLSYKDIKLLKAFEKEIPAKKAKVSAVCNCMRRLDRKRVSSNFF